MSQENGGSAARTGAKRVLLIVPPYHPLTAPALGVSLLKAELARLAVSVDLRYLNLDLAELTGRELYGQLVRNARALVGDWLFAEDLFGDRAPEPQPFVDRVLRAELGLDEALVAQIVALRAAIPAFLDRQLRALPLDDYAIVLIAPDFTVGEDRIQNCPALALLRRCKRAAPAITTVMGGANCEGPLGAAMLDLFPFVDFVCTGEGEQVIPRLIGRLLGGEPAGDLPGILGRDRAGRPDTGLRPPLVRDLDRLPYPDYDDYFAQLGASGLGPEPAPYLLFETSRGCWWGEKHPCTFCGLNGTGMQYRSKSPERALAELDHLVDRHGVRAIFATDMILDPRYFESFIPTLAGRALPPSIFFEIKANLTKEQLRLLRSAGIREIQPGVESLSTPMLRLMDKGVSALQNVRLLKWCAEIGIDPFWNILYGFPGEDPAEYDRMAALVPALTHLPPPRRVIRIRLDRFSPNFDQSAARGFANVRPAAAYDTVYPFAETDLRRLAYYFDYDYADGRDPDGYTRDLRRAVEGWRDRAGSASLELRDCGDRLELIDRRAPIPTTTTLVGPARQAYLALDAGQTVPGLQAALERALGTAPPAREIEAWLAAWTADRLVIQEGPRFLALATNPDGRVVAAAERISALIARATRNQPAS